MKHAIRMIVSEGAAKVTSRSDWTAYVKEALQVAEQKRIGKSDSLILDGPNALKIVVVGMHTVYILTKEEADAGFLPEKGSMN